MKTAYKQSLSGIDIPVSTTLNRRTFLKNSSALVFAVNSSGALSLLTLNTAQAQTLIDSPRSISPDSLDTWLAFDLEGNVTAYFGKMDMGQGVDTAIAQIVAEELDLSVERVSVVMGDTHLTPDQGGASGSSGCRQGANPLRAAAAEARRILMERASEILATPVETLSVEDGVISSTDNSISYSSLIADGFNTALDWNGNYGNGLNVTGQAATRNPAEYKVVGRSVARKDIPGKILATTEFCHHVVLPGMLHARNIRPPVAGAVPVAVNDDSISAWPDVQIVRTGDYLAVVAESEWHAISAAQALEVTWDEVVPPFPGSESLSEHIRYTTAVSDSATGGFFGRPYDPAPALAAIESATRQVEAEYTVAFQSHARMAPSVGVADVKENEAVIWSDTQKSHNTRDGIAQILGMKPENVRVIWKPGPGSYGRSDADEAAFEAAVLSRQLGCPVRVQWMRDEGHAWDPKAPACVINCRAGINGNDVSGWLYHAKGFSGWDVNYNAGHPRDTLVGQLTGYDKGDAHNFGTPGESYDFPAQVKYWETIPPLLNRASPLRTSHMRAPQEPQQRFAHESFIDEVAHAMDMDPIELRLKYLTNERERNVIETVAEMTSWANRPPASAIIDGPLKTGRGIAINNSFGGIVATVCEVEVNTETGYVRARDIYVAHDCGLVINPRGLRTTIEGNIVQGLSRTLFEEVQFDERMVTSVDWLTYPILDIQDAPDSIEITLVARPDLPPGGAGEPSHVTVPAAVANAVFDATGARVRSMPLTPQRVKATLDALSD